MSTPSALAILFRPVHRVLMRIARLLMSITSAFGCTAAIILLLSVPASADFLYTVSYDAKTIEATTTPLGGTIEARTYAADSFSFLASSILPPSDQGGDIVSVPGGELNGLTFTSISWGGEALLEAFPDFSTFSLGEVSALAFNLNDFRVPDSIGTYTTTYAGRGIGFLSDSNNRGVLYEYGTGSLTISEVSSPVPEPGSWMLVLSVLGPVLVRRRLHCWSDFRRF